MPYWNRDLSDPKLADRQPFRVWHDDCFEPSVGPRPARWQQQAPRVFASAEEFVDSIFGGAEHRADLEALPDNAPLAHYRATIARWQDDAVAPVTPLGYAWAPWRGGAPCHHCGKDC